MQKRRHTSSIPSIAESTDSGPELKQEFMQATQWYSKASEQNYSDAWYCLGRFYAAGRGVERDVVQAHMWFSLAATHFHEKAPTKRDEIAKKMTSTQIVEAKKLAKQWKQK